MIIQNHWKYWRKRNHLTITLPGFLLALVFSIQACVLMPNIQNVDKKLINGFYLANFILAAYFVIISIISLIGLCCNKATRGKVTVDGFLSVIAPGLIVWC